MARKSRKQVRLEENHYFTAFYLRLSNKNKLNKLSESIENQKILLQDFIKGKQEFQHIATFMDDGKTGTDFNRPGFEQMMEAVKKRTINCIIVKDLSRLGRNFLETGDLIENIFPLWQVRFIAVTDGFDSISASASDLAFLMPLKNMMNENYARDISIKERSAKKILRKRGAFVGPLPIYGYTKDETNKHQLCIDSEAAHIVKTIFDMGEQNISDRAIARYLNEQKIACPSRYKYERGILHNEKYANTSGWYPQTVAAILSSRIYIGDMVQGGYCSHEMKGKRIIIPEDERDIVPNRHEPIISREQYEKVAELRAVRHNNYKASHQKKGQKTVNDRGWKGFEKGSISY